MGLERGRMAQLGGAEPPLQLALFAGRPLGVDEQAEALLEAEGGGLASSSRRAQKHATATAVISVTDSAGQELRVNTGGPAFEAGIGPGCYGGRTARLPWRSSHLRTC